ncbi:D-alanine--D-alanine ligase family protein [Eisenibacter elegans]|uniref:D-alanine--D-alanine ligase family protein n=1 Tax=Eisenibacter elegans TaxID=997 RepID=UPI0004150466|nr:D-alanine--D-alanine ligase [Eisenibacter elegans]
MKVGIFFGGQSREREVSFAGGRTVYDNLDKQLFEPVPIFVDSLGNFILLEWPYVYKGTIRDFYPPVAEIQRLRGEAGSRFQIYLESLGQLSAADLEAVVAKVGRRIYPHEFAQLMDVAFLALHGGYGEDGNIQGLLEWYGIPYTGSGILPSAIGINKTIQGQILKQAGFLRPKQQLISREEWLAQPHDQRGFWATQLVQQSVQFPVVVKAPNQGSSIGISIVREQQGAEALAQAIDKGFFIQTIDLAQWRSLSTVEKERFLYQFTDIREGLGFPVRLRPDAADATETVLYHPQELYALLEQYPGQQLTLEAEQPETQVLLESFIEGKEFSCIVIEQEAHQPHAPRVVALPPTEIRKTQYLFDYRAKYLPGISRKITPIETTPEKIAEIRQACERLFQTLHCQVYARIDGFLDNEGNIYLNDPNTTSGMMPASFFFHQAAEIGLNPSQFLTYLIRTSLKARHQNGKFGFRAQALLTQLDAQINLAQTQELAKIRVAVVMGGYSSERHISMESGRNVYEKLASSTKYEPFPVFLTGSDQAHELYHIPINIMLKDNADDTREKIKHHEAGVYRLGSEVLTQIIDETADLRRKYAGSPLMHPKKLNYAQLAAMADAVFIALHGRPGEDGALQAELEKVGLPYNGSGVSSSQLTINKYETNKRLRQEGIAVAGHTLVERHEWQANPEALLDRLEAQFSYPLIAKPADDGCSSAVKKITSRQALTAFAQMMFRPTPEFLPEASTTLRLKPSEEFPQKEYFLVEELIDAKGAQRFLEITCGLLTHHQPDGSLRYEVLLPSETPALGDVLSLEEKFLAGEGQNITPAPLAADPQANQALLAQVQQRLAEVAQILQIEGYARIDAFVRVYDQSRAEVVVIEINSLPGMTPATVIFHQAALNQYKPYQFIDAILTFALAKQNPTALSETR